MEYLWDLGDGDPISSKILLESGRSANIVISDISTNGRFIDLVYNLKLPAKEYYFQLDSTTCSGKQGSMWLEYSFRDRIGWTE